jgi:hypothetical protein
MDAVSRSHSSLPCSPLSSAFSAQLFSSILLPIITVSRFPSSPAQAASHYHGRPSTLVSAPQSPSFRLTPNHSPIFRMKSRAMTANGAWVYLSALPWCGPVLDFARCPQVLRCVKFLLCDRTQQPPRVRRRPDRRLRRHPIDNGR